MTSVKKKKMKKVKQKIQKGWWGYIGRMDDLGIKAGCKNRVGHHSFIRSEVDEAEPFDNVMEWLELLDFRVRTMNQNFFESLCGSQVLKKDLFGRSNLGDHLVVDGLIFDIHLKT